MFERKQTRKIKIGNIAIGGDAPVTVQSMTKTKTADFEATADQINRCAEAGCDIMRVTVNTPSAAEGFGEIVKRVSIPVVADIHFNHIFALKAIDGGASKIRINPGNIGSEERIKEVLDASKSANVPIRIGVNSGSLEKELLQKYGHPTAEALFESAMRHVNICKKYDFENLIIAVKSSNVKLMIDAYRMLSEKTDFPLHLGVTEAGSNRKGTIKSSVGIGALLAEGIGDTIRVSLTDEPEREVETGIEILRSLDLRPKGIEIISCPTCGRLDADMFSIVEKVERELTKVDKKLTVAVMGCIVNGPGEAKEADIGVACGNGKGIIFMQGNKIMTVSEDKIAPTLLAMIEENF